MSAAFVWGRSCAMRQAAACKHRASFPERPRGSRSGSDDRIRFQVEMTGVERLGRNHRRGSGSPRTSACRRISKSTVDFRSRSSRDGDGKAPEPTAGSGRARRMPPQRYSCRKPRERHFAICVSRSPTRPELPRPTATLEQHVQWVCCRLTGLLFFILDGFADELSRLAALHSTRRGAGRRQRHLEPGPLGHA